MRQTVRLLPTIAATTLVLAGCTSSSAGSGPQTQEEACALIQVSMEELAEQLEGYGEDQIDAMVETSNSHLDKLDSEVRNPEVAEVWEPISQLQRDALAAAAVGDKEGTMGAYLLMTESYETFWEVCPLDATE